MTDLLTNEPQDEVDPNIKNYIEELVGPGKKFQTVEDMAKGKYLGDVHAKILERRLDEFREDNLKLRAENLAKARLEELIERSKNQQLASSEEPIAKEAEKKPYDQKEIESLVSNKIQEMKTTEKYDNNFNLVKNKLQEVYGRNYQDTLATQLSELGLTGEQANDMARKHPQVLLRTLGLDKPMTQRENFQSPPQSQKRSDNFAPNSGQKRTWSYYQDLRKKNPSAWYDSKIAVQMEKDAIALGDAFEDGDFKLYN